MTLAPEVTPVEQLEKRVAELEQALRAKDEQLNAVIVTLKSSRTGSQKSANQTPQQPRNLLQLVLNTIPARVFWKDRQGVFLGCNQLGASDLGLPSPEAIIGTTDYDYFEAAAVDGFREADLAVMESGIPKLNFEEPLPRPDGSLLWLNTSKVPMRDTDGNIVGIMVTYEDITERKVAEQEREKLLLSEQEARREAQEAVRLKDLFLATMSHELRTPLNAMIGFQHLMLYSGQLNEDNIHMTERTIANSQRLLNLINNILDISRIATGGLKIVPVTMSPRQLANGILTDLTLQAKEKGLELNIKVEDSVPETIVHEEERLGQIALNLVNNAIKFTERGSVETSIMREDERLIIQVKDTGIGIPTSKQHVIFDDFVQVDNSSTRKHQGAGLGLAIVKRLVLLMQGSIQLESEIGQGSTFTVTLPLNLKVES